MTDHASAKENQLAVGLGGSIGREQTSNTKWPV